MGDNGSNVFDCLCCLAEGTAHLKLDKRNRPYVKCYSCGSMTFIHSEDGLRGLAFLCPTLRPLLNKLGAVGRDQARTSAADLSTRLKEAANG